MLFRISKTGTLITGVSLGLSYVLINFKILYQNRFKDCCNTLTSCCGKNVFVQVCFMADCMLTERTFIRSINNNKKCKISKAHNQTPKEHALSA